MSSCAGSTSKARGGASPSSPASSPEAPASADAFGAALLAAGRYALESADGSVVFEDADAYFDDDWWPEVSDALERLRGRVLDVGCGAGRHALWLGRRGCYVVGIDSSPGAVEVSRRRGVDARVGSLGAPGLLDGARFDAVVMLGNGLGLLRGADDLLWLAERCRPGALLVGDAVAGDPPRTRLRIRFGSIVGEWFDFWQAAPDELRTVAVAAGWRVESVAGGATARYVATLRLVDD